MSRARYRYRTYRIGLDEEEHAEPLGFTMACVGCGAEAGTVTDPWASRDWIVRHLKDEPTHLTYRETVTRPFRAHPEAWC